MAVSKVRQREIVEVPFTFPDGSILPHPAMVVSNDSLQDVEPGMFYAVLISSKNHVPEITIPILSEWLSKPLAKKSYFVTHIIGMYNVSDVIKTTSTFLRQPYFNIVIDRIHDVIVNGDF